MLTLLAPTARHYETGGYLYNRFIAEAAPERLRSLHLPAEAASAFLRSKGGERLLLDSLWLSHPAVVESCRDKPFVWLLHYVPGLDPSVAAGGSSEPRVQLELLRCAKALLVTSQFMARELGKLGLDRPILVCEPGLSEQLLASRGRAMQLRGPLRFLTVANLVPGKGLLEAIEFWKVFSQREAQWEWWLLGDVMSAGRYTPKIMEAWKAAALPGTLRLLGARDYRAMPPIYAEVDACFGFSRFESFGMALQEAAAMGLPLLAPKQGAWPELLPENAGQLYYEWGDWVDAAAKAWTLLEPLKSRRPWRIWREAPPLTRSWAMAAAELEASVLKFFGVDVVLL